MKIALIVMAVLSIAEPWSGSVDAARLTFGVGQALCDDSSRDASPVYTCGQWSCSCGSSDLDAAGGPKLPPWQWAQDCDDMVPDCVPGSFVCDHECGDSCCGGSCRLNP
jgi:hypothetical protein